MSIRPLGRVLRAEEAGLYRDAAGALAIARAQAAAADAGHRRALTAERERVLRDARVEAQAEAARILAEAEQAARRTTSGLTRDIAEAIAEAVARVIGGLDLAEAVARAALRAVSELAERHTLVIEVHPDMLAEVSARLSGVVARVAPDPTMPPDGCVVRSAAGLVRVSLSEQLDTLARVLREAAP